MKQLDAVFEIMRDGVARTPQEICAIAAQSYGTFMSGSAATARLRDLRKARHGGHRVELVPRYGSSQPAYRVTIRTVQVVPLPPPLRLVLGGGQ